MSRAEYAWYGEQGVMVRVHGDKITVQGEGEARERKRRKEGSLRQKWRDIRSREGRET